MGPVSWWPPGHFGGGGSGLRKKQQVKRGWGSRPQRSVPPSGFPFGPDPVGWEHVTDPSDGPAMVLNVGPDGVILYVHRCVLAPEGEDISETSIFDHTVPHQRDVVRSTLERVFATGEADEYECRGFPPFVEDPWYQCRVAPNRSITPAEGSGPPDAVVSATVIMRDITRWKRAEKKLRQECDELKARLEQRSATLNETRVQQNLGREQLQQASADVARLAATLLERNKELERARARRNDDDHKQRDSLSAEVARLTAALSARDRDLELQEVRQVEDRLTVATTAARHSTRWKLVEADLERERAEHKAHAEQLSEELAKQAYLHDRHNREGDRFRTILDQAGEAILITDPQTRRFVDANETACRWLGCRRATLLTLRTSDLDLEFPIDASGGLPEHVVDTRKSTRAQVLRNGVVRRRNGTTFAVEVAIARVGIRGRDYTLVVARDTNARRPVEEALREGEEKYRDLFNFSRDAIYLSARDGSVADANAAAVEVFGYTREEFLGLRASELYENTKDIRVFQRAVDENGFVRDLAVGFRAKDGTPIRGLLTATLRHAGDGTVLGYQCLIRPLSG